MHAESRSRTGQQRGLVLSIPGEALSLCSVHALERELQELTVLSRESIDAACMRFDAPVRLILVEAGLSAELMECAAVLAAWHPVASVALIVDDPRVPLSRYRQLALAGTVRGILPMNLRLDLWLSVIRLLASGGEYFPASLLQSKGVSGTAGVRVPRLDGTAAVHSRGRLGDLTEREVQVLDLVSRGRQNKTIAANLNLSEHTVKVHLHNIISKMQVSNRTEAASLYLERRAAASRLAASASPDAVEE
jgi:DNA-binding NarL/FixJ family response regulator